MIKVKILLESAPETPREIADKLAAIYRCGFEYCYFDGSEGTNAPFGFHVSNAQYRVFKKLTGKAPTDF